MDSPVSATKPSSSFEAEQRKQKQQQQRQSSSEDFSDEDGSDDDDDAESSSMGPAAGVSLLRHFGQNGCGAPPTPAFVRPAEGSTPLSPGAFFRGRSSQLGSLSSGGGNQQQRQRPTFGFFTAASPESTAGSGLLGSSSVRVGERRVPAATTATPTAAAAAFADGTSPILRNFAAPFSSPLPGMLLGDAGPPLLVASPTEAAFGACFAGWRAFCTVALQNVCDRAICVMAEVLGPCADLYGIAGPTRWRVEPHGFALCNAVYGPGAESESDCAALTFYAVQAVDAAAVPGQPPETPMPPLNLRATGLTVFANGYAVRPPLVLEDSGGLPLSRTILLAADTREATIFVRNTGSATEHLRMSFTPSETASLDVEPRSTSVRPGSAVEISVSLAHPNSVLPQGATLTLSTLSGSTLSLGLELCSEPVAIHRLQEGCSEEGEEEGGGEEVPAELIDFGEVPLGELFNGLARCENDGREPLSFKARILSGSHASASDAFIFAEDPPPELDAGSAAELKLQFAPRRPGSYEASMQLLLGGRQVKTLVLRGVCSKPTWKVSSTALDFGPLSPSRRPTKVVEVRNPGSIAVHIAVTTALTQGSGLVSLRVGTTDSSAAQHAADNPLLLEVAPNSSSRVLVSIRTAPAARRVPASPVTGHLFFESLSVVSVAEEELPHSDVRISAMLGAAASLQLPEGLHSVDLVQKAGNRRAMARVLMRNAGSAPLSITLSAQPARYFSVNPEATTIPPQSVLRAIVMLAHGAPSTALVQGTLSISAFGVVCEAVALSGAWH